MRIEMIEDSQKIYCHNSCLFIPSHRRISIEPSWRTTTIRTWCDTIAMLLTRHPEFCDSKGIFEETKNIFSSYDLTSIIFPCYFHVDLIFAFWWNMMAMLILVVRQGIHNNIKQYFQQISHDLNHLALTSLWEARRKLDAQPAPKAEQAETLEEHRPGISGTAKRIWSRTDLYFDLWKRYPGFRSPCHSHRVVAPCGQVDAQIEKVDRMLRAGAVPRKQRVSKIEENLFGQKSLTVSVGSAFFSQKWSIAV